ncbi:MAG: YdeI/OmpD-associated family protein [Weeksellaceae bacterium]|nr:YdeI/OmpD-associated family protein [Weeksellaceae bacterium]
MKGAKTVDEYIENQDIWRTQMQTLRQWLNETDLEETIKWGAPCYVHNKTNLVGLAGFKNHMAVWFHQGVFIDDKHQNLIASNEDTTKALRQWRLEKDELPEKAIFMDYVRQTIANTEKGVKHKSEQKELIIPEMLQQMLDEDDEFNRKFNELTRGKRVEYGEYIASAKQDKTRLARLEKIRPLIDEGKGLHDKYKNC